MRGLLLMLVGGCTWVTQADKDALLPYLDNDGDGFVNDADCDPDDGAIHPRADEIWYDGIDQNCDGLNDFDQDEDGYVATEFEAQQLESVAAEAQLPGGDCCDLNDNISPIQPDPAYDGVDQNCDSADDFDADADGHSTDVDRTEATRVPDEICPDAQQAWVSGDDCYDSEQDITEGFQNPARIDAAEVNGGADETWYDGTNQDCDDCDDYDQDCDGYRADGQPQGDDCDDTAETVHPEQAETWYDGIDQNCDGLDDYDQDGDGFVGGIDGEDCDDEDPAITPYATEIIGDQVDSDCDGNVNSFRVNGLTTIGWSFADVQSVIYGEADGYLYLSVNGNQIAAVFETGADQTFYDGTAAIRWIADNAVLDAIDGIQQWGASTGNSNLTVLDAHDLQVVDGVIYDAAASNIVISGSDYPKILVYSNAIGVAEPVQIGSPRRLHEDIGLAIDSSGVSHTFSCNGTDGTLIYYQLDDAGNDFYDELAGYASPVCAAEAYGTPHVLLMSGANLTEYDFTVTTDLVLSESGRWWALDPLDIDAPNGLQSPAVVVADQYSHSVRVIDSDGDVLPVSNLTDYPVAVSLREDPAGNHVIGYVTEAGAAHILYQSGLVYRPYDITLPDGFLGTDISVWANASGVHVAVAGMYGDGSYDVALARVDF